MKHRTITRALVDVAEHLVARGYTSPDRLYGQGGSAGGLLMGPWST
jgi:oligopeptidase B